MKFSVEVEIDWIDEENNLDDQVKQSLINGLARKIEDQVSKNVGIEIANTAENLVRAKTELIINSVLEKPITINKGWHKDETYDSIFDMVEQQMTELYEGKIISKGTCKEDPLLSNVKKYVDTAVNKLLKDVQIIIERKAAENAKAAVKESELMKAISSVVTIKD